MTVLAAASLADALADVARRFEADEDVSVEISSASSGALRRQIELGAPWDVYVPAAKRYLDELEQTGLLAPGTRIGLARNRLVLVTTQAGAAVWSDLSPLSDPALGPIAIASPEHAPAGCYAEQALRKRGLWKPLGPRLVYANNVRLAGRYVADGAARAGIVYATDALAFAEGVSLVYRFADTDHAPIELQGAVSLGADPMEPARRFLAFAASAEALPCWTDRGFEPPTSPDRRDR